MFVFQVYMYAALIIIISTILTPHSDMYVTFLENYLRFNRLKHSLTFTATSSFCWRSRTYLGNGIKPVEIER